MNCRISSEGIDFVKKNVFIWAAVDIIEDYSTLV